MSEERWETVNGIMMTTERIGAYGGTGFDREMLESAAASIKANGLPMHVEHDLGRPIRVRNFDAFVENRADGIDLLRFSVEIHPDDAHWANDLGSVSFTMTTPIDRPSGYVEPDAPEIAISADHAWFDDDAILAAETAMRSAGVAPELISAERALQFSFLPDPQIFLSVAMDLLTGLGSSAIWEGVLILFRSRRTPPGGDAEKSTTINLTLLNDESSMTAVIETNSEAVALRALDSVDEMVRAIRGQKVNSDAEAHLDALPSEPSTVIWDDQARKWTPPA
ncbi:hypothetical protein [Microbacterium sp. CFBP9034]|uniref:hypothetical protein n=1 Tax=Microbacterium sp. CFBP9034 TaxID=3096540 RepID=UPI002A69D906|nr:hypothetical protein [Microbacterium sp. CFBP9034]MDY0909518.1 hypothetical protein [Microbacterium sp. CFBP9034]